MRTDQLSIRLLNSGDTNMFYHLIQKNLSRLEDTFAGTVVKTQDLTMTKEFIEDAIHRTSLKTYYPFAICKKNSNEIIGFIDLKNINWDIPKTEVGYFIDVEYEGKGIASWALSYIVDYCFKKLKMEKLSLRTMVMNIGSQKVAMKNGFQREGLIRKDYKTMSGELIDLVYFGLVRT